jgi:polyphosphate glucokinase
VGGGVSKNPEKFLPGLKTNAPIVVAEHQTNAGIIGAASLVLG